MTDETRTLLESLLAWDDARVTRMQLRKPAVDFSDYIARQARAAAALDTAIEDWTQEIREHFRALLEVSMTPSAIVGVYGVRARVRVDQPAALPSATRVELIAVADEIGELQTLGSRGAKAWRVAP